MRMCVAEPDYFGKCFIYLFIYQLCFNLAYFLVHIYIQEYDGKEQWQYAAGQKKQI